MINKYKRRDFDSGDLLLACIVGLGAVLRLWNLDRTSLWYDEAVSWTQSSGSLSHLFTSVAADNYPPLHNLLLWLTIPVLGDSEIALRLPSAVTGVISIWLIYALGKLVFGRKPGLLAAFLLTLSPFHIWYSTEARMYALFAATGLAFLIALVKTLKGGGGRWMALTAMFGAFFLYSHIYAAFAVTAVGTSLLWCLGAGGRRNRSSSEIDGLRQSVLAVLAAAFLFLPWFIILMTRATDVVSNGFWIAYPDLSFLKVMARDMAGSELLFLFLLCLNLICMGSVFLGKQKEDTHRQSIAILAAFTFGPFLIAYVLSIALRPILFDRYLIASWPVFLLLASAGTCRLGPKYGPAALITVTLALTFQPLTFTVQEKIRPEWRKVASIYLEERHQGAPLLLYKGFANPALKYYLRQPDGIHPVRTPADLPNLAERSEVWLVLAHSSEAEMTNFIKQMPVGFKEMERWKSFGWGASGLTLLRYQRTGPEPR